jgi:hypothetical protein
MNLSKILLFIFLLIFINLGLSISILVKPKLKDDYEENNSSKKDIVVFSGYMLEGGPILHT